MISSFVAMASSMIGFATSNIALWNQISFQKVFWSKNSYTVQEIKLYKYIIT